ncbi:SIS domain-containing protein [candidate division KSB1 bacterium]|nr:MAG: SIS domain-containing protein [candidate division KSB1 bacterium]
MSTRREHIEDYLSTLRRVLDELPVDSVEKIIEVFEKAYDLDKTIFLCGNGGSASTASHWACDLAKGTVTEGHPRLRAISVADNLAILTAYGNDLDYTHIFSEPLRTYGKPGDIAVLITASGNSPNILEAAKAARDLDMITIGLIGFGGGKLQALVDYHITVGCREYGPVEDLHLILDHIISLYLRRVVAGEIRA